MKTFNEYVESLNEGVTLNEAVEATPLGTILKLRRSLRKWAKDNGHSVIHVAS